VENAELPFEAARRLLLAGQVHHQRMHAQPHALDLPGREARLGAEPQAEVDHRMHHQAAREGLVGVAHDFPALAQPFRDPLRREGGGQDGGEAPAALDRVRRRVETLRGQQRREHAVLRRAAGMEALRHRPEMHPEPHRLRRREADGPGRPLRVEAEQPRRRGARPDRAGRPGDVPAGVVVRG
jgi:hypothetical protein